MSLDDDTKYMRIAIEASRSALAKGNMPYGAALVSAGGELLHVSENNQVSTGDCTGHAEVALIREAGAKFGPQVLEGATVYASGEPCAMCAGALFWARVARVVFGAPNATLMRLGGKPTLALDSADVLRHGSHAVRVDGPLLEEEAAEVIATKR